MNRVNLSEQLKQILQIIEKWNSADVAYIERDIVLSKLQSVYQQILFSKTSETKSHEIDKQHEIECAITTKEVVTTTVHESIVCENCDADADVSKVEQDAQQDTKQEAQQESVVPEVSIEVQIDVETKIDEVITENNIPAPVVAPAPSVRHMFDRNAIKSLYDDDSCTARTTTTVVETHIEEQTITSAEAVVSTTSFVDTTHCSVIGDVIMNGTRTIGDEFSSSVTTRDVATSIACGNSVTLKGAIGINDKFLMLKEMFNGDILSYQSTIEMLEEFTDMDDALIFIHDNFDWNPNGTGVKLLIELLNRKLS